MRGLDHGTAGMWTVHDDLVLGVLMTWKMMVLASIEV